MPNLQVIVDARDVSPADLADCLATLVPQATVVGILHADDRSIGPVRDRFGLAVAEAGSVPSGEAVLVTTAKAAYASGSLARLAARAAMPGRVVTRVFVPGLDLDDRVAWWSGEWVREHELGAADLAAAGIEFDRAHLPLDSSRARFWVRADEVGVAPIADAQPMVRSWARSEGRRLRRRTIVAALRSRAGVVRRRVWLRSQRRKLPRFQRSR